MNSLYRNVADLISAIEECRKREQLLPCLVLLYTGIDVLGSLERQSNGGIRASFTRWVSQYLLDGLESSCTADDLYGARCGILHTFTAESDLSRKEKARQVVYAWGSSSSQKLQRTSELIGRNSVAVHLDELIREFKTAASRFLCEVQHDPERRQVVAAQAGMWFTNMKPILVDELLQMAGGQMDT